MDVGDPAGDALLPCVWQGLTTVLSPYAGECSSFMDVPTLFSGGRLSYHFITGTSTPLFFQWWILRTKIAPKLCALSSTGLSSHSPGMPPTLSSIWQHSPMEFRLQRAAMFGCSQCQHRLLQAREDLPACAGQEPCTASACTALAAWESGFTGAQGWILQVLSAIWHAQSSLFPHTS